MNEASTPPPVISAKGIHKMYVGGDGSPIDVLTGADLEIHAGETVAIIGESGSGKSTLLHILGVLDSPTKGSVEVAGRRVDQLNEDELSKLRNASLGFVFQFHHLLREFTVLENVMIPQIIAKRHRGEARDRARELLRDVGLEGRLEHKPTQLSGGEQQRVAVARALANDPVALLADEPSGNLDPSTSDRLHELLFSISSIHRTAMILVTHNMQLAAKSDRVLEVRAGKLEPAAAEAMEYPKRSVV